MTRPTVWLASAAPGPCEREEDRRCLPPAELRHAVRLRVPAARARHVAARACLRRVLGARLGLPPSAVALASTSDGALQVVGHPDLHVSISHTTGLVLVAVSTGGPVGVDVERADRERLPPVQAWVVPEELAALPDASAADRRRALLQLWTAKEAVTKALGTGLGTPLRAVTVIGDEAHGPGQVTGWHIEPIALPPTHVGTVALRHGCAELPVLVGLTGDRSGSSS